MAVARTLTGLALICRILAVAPLSAAIVELPVVALSPTIESDWTSIYYSNTTPLLLGNDGSAATGGWVAWQLDSDTPVTQVYAETPGRRTKLATAVHRADGKKKKDLVVSIGQPDSIVRAWTLPDFKEIKSAQFTALGDWSALCTWNAESGNDYLYLLGKKQAKVFLVVEEKNGQVRFAEVLTFPMPIEPSGCAPSPSLRKMYLSADDDKNIYAFDLTESTAPPAISTASEVEDDVTGVAVYVSNDTGIDYLLIASENKVAVYNSSFSLIGDLELVGMEDIEVQGLSVYQGALAKYPRGALVYAIEAEDTVGFGVSSLDGALQALGIRVNTAYNPRVPLGQGHPSPICNACSGNGYCTTNNGSSSSSQCACFAGWKGKHCDKFTCEDNCSGHGKCMGPNACRCEKGWGDLHCSFVLVEPAAETEANGGDGDDPAIWISPSDRALSRIITTTKSAEGAGLGVFDLGGKLLQNIPAGEPNNVDIIYGFQAGPRKVDLAFAACREDDSLCLFEITPNGTLTTIPGGHHPVIPDFTVYGSCAYKSRTANRQYLFVNSKTSQYLQYELTSTPDGTLNTTLVRSFFAGSGGQVEGCVSDEDNGWVFIGEEPNALWRYDAEPTSSSTDPNLQGIAVATVGDGHLRADVEGVTLVHGKTKDKGFILVSTQGVSGYNVYRRRAPHEFVMAFSITESSDGKVDAVSNTDGIAAVSTNLGGKFPRGLVVVHDDSNEVAKGKGTSVEASFKLVSLKDVLGADVVKKLGLLEDVDRDWDPRA